ncbi:hypothetical protein ACFRMQ_20810, partial [Kitasatospora sp. NPDC056783]
MDTTPGSGSPAPETPAADGVREGAPARTPDGVPDDVHGDVHGGVHGGVHGRGVRATPGTPAPDFTPAERARGRARRRAQ